MKNWLKYFFLLFTFNLISIPENDENFKAIFLSLSSFEDSKDNFNLLIQSLKKISKKFFYTLINCDRYEISGNKIKFFKGAEFKEFDKNVEDEFIKIIYNIKQNFEDLPQEDENEDYYLSEIDQTILNTIFIDSNKLRAKLDGDAVKIGEEVFDKKYFNQDVRRILRLNTNNLDIETINKLIKCCENNKDLENLKSNLKKLKIYHLYSKIVKKIEESYMMGADPFFHPFIKSILYDQEFVEEKIEAINAKFPHISKEFLQGKDIKVVEKLLLRGLESFDEEKLNFIFEFDEKFVKTNKLSFEDIFFYLDIFFKKTVEKKHKDKFFQLLNKYFSLDPNCEKFKSFKYFLKFNCSINDDFDVVFEYYLNIQKRVVINEAFHRKSEKFFNCFAIFLNRSKNIQERYFVNHDNKLTEDRKPNPEQVFFKNCVMACDYISKYAKTDEEILKMIDYWVKDGTNKQDEEKRIEEFFTSSGFLVMPAQIPVVNQVSAPETVAFTVPTNVQESDFFSQEEIEAYFKGIENPEDIEHFEEAKNLIIENSGFKKWNLKFFCNLIRFKNGYSLLMPIILFELDNLNQDENRQSIEAFADVLTKINSKKTINFENFIDCLNYISKNEKDFYVQSFIWHVFLASNNQVYFIEKEHCSKLREFFNHPDEKEKERRLNFAREVFFALKPENTTNWHNIINNLPDRYKKACDEVKVKNLGVAQTDNSMHSEQNNLVNCGVEVKNPTPKKEFASEMTGYVAVQNDNNSKVSYVDKNGNDRKRESVSEMTVSVAVQNDNNISNLDYSGENHEDDPLISEGIEADDLSICSENLVPLSLNNEMKSKSVVTKKASNSNFDVQFGYTKYFFNRKLFVRCDYSLFTSKIQGVFGKFMEINSANVFISVGIRDKNVVICAGAIFFEKLKIELNLVSFNSVLISIGLLSSNNFHFQFEEILTSV